MPEKYNILQLTNEFVTGSIEEESVRVLLTPCRHGPKIEGRHETILRKDIHERRVWRPTESLQAFVRVSFRTQKQTTD